MAAPRLSGSTAPTVTRPRRAAHDDVLRGRLNPFLLPSPTTSRFVLLIALTLTTAGAAAAELFALLPHGSNAWIGGCAAAARAAAAAAEPDIVVVDGFRSCVAWSGRLNAMVFTAAAVLAGLLVIAEHLAAARRTARGLVPLDEIRHSDRSAMVGRLAQDAGVALGPAAVLVDMSRPHPHGLTFGHRDRLRIRVSLGALQLAESGRPEVLRAILRHELAHLRNRDVDLGGLTCAAGRVLLPVLLLVPIVAAMARPDAVFLLPLLGRLAVLALLVWLVRAAVLRSREHEADVRASIPAVRAGEPAFDGASFPDPPGCAVSAARRRWWDLTGTHPSAAGRLDVVMAPHRLLQAGFGEALATGVTAGLLLDHVRTLLLNAGIGFLTFGPLLPGLVVGGLVTAVVGTALWRATLAALATGGMLPTGIPAGLGLATGLVVGQVIGPGDPNAPLRTAFATAPGPALGAVALLLLGCLLFARWTVTAAASWLPVAGARSLRPVLWAGFVVATSASGAALTSFSGLAVRIGGGLPAERLHVVFLTDAFSPRLAIPLLVAALFPLAAAVRASRPATARAIYADTGRTVFLPRPRWRLAAVFGPAVATGVLATVVAVAVASTGLLPTALALSFAVLSRFGTPSADDVGYGVVGLAGCVALLAAVTAGMLAGGRGSAGTALAHASGAAVLTAGTLALVGATSTAVTCATVGCPDGDPLLQVASLPLMVFAGGLTATVLGLPLAAGIGRIALLARSRPAAWRETVVTGRHHRRRPPARAAVCTVLVLAAICAGAYGVWSPARLEAANSPIIAVDVPDDSAPASVPRDLACADVRAAALAASTMPSGVIASRVAAADDAALAAMGRLWRDGARDGRAGAILAGSVAAAYFCEFLRFEVVS